MGERAMGYEMSDQLNTKSPIEGAEMATKRGWCEAVAGPKGNAGSFSKSWHLHFFPSRRSLPLPITFFISRPGWAGIHLSPTLIFNSILFSYPVNAPEHDSG